MKYIELLLSDGGDISLGPVASFKCVASAADDNNALAMLVRRDDETLNALLKRLDKAIARAWELEEFTDEVNH